MKLNDSYLNFSGQQIKLSHELSSNKNACDCKTKSVQILTPSQEKDESELWKCDESEKSLKCAKCQKSLEEGVNCCECNADITWTDDADPATVGHLFSNHCRLLQNANNSDNLSIYSVHMEKDFR